ncbi:MAG: sulfatase-like hydrolase/transferase [Lentisphaeria bacterium]|nr:sulfatase-like hydrolase/transferase [Lentisphaeria bacterium]
MINKTITQLIIMLSFCLTITLAAKQKELNVVLIMVDDMRFDQLSRMGHPYIQTPHIDELAKRGISFTRAYVSSPVCGPSRASIFTGQLPSIHNRRTNFQSPDSYSVYIPELFKKAGYQTALIGKYYEGRTFKKQILNEKYYDELFLTAGPVWPSNIKPQDRKKFFEENLYYNQNYEINGRLKHVKGYQTELLFREANQFIKNNRAKKFFLCLSPFAPHFPFNPSPLRKDKYRGKGIPKTKNLELSSLSSRQSKLISEASEKMAAMIEDVDDGVGTLLETLEVNKLLDHTLIIFTSDNGTCFGEHGSIWKRHAWEEAVKVPLIVYYPKSKQRGTQNKELVSLADILITAADAAQVHLPKDPARYGKSFKSLLDGSKKNFRDTVTVIQYPMDSRNKDAFFEDPSWVSLIAKDYKLTITNKQYPSDHLPEMLFYLSEDQYETQDLSKADITKVKHLKSLLLYELEQNNCNIGWVKE